MRPTEAEAVTPRPVRICRIVTVPWVFATWLRTQIQCVADAGMDLTLVSSPGVELDAIRESMPNVRCRAIRIARRPSPARDLRSLLELVAFFRRERFDIVHSSTPKAGLLTALAGVASRTPVRLHTYTGQAWVELRGPTRFIARECDRLIGRLSSHTYADSRSQREYLVAQGLVPPMKISVLGAGSISGVDLDRFDPDRLAAMRAPMRRELGFDEQAVVIAFVGRVTIDKGVAELVEAFCRLSERNPALGLVLVGPQEPERDPLPADLLRKISTLAHIRAVGFSPRPERYLAAADIFCLPSYREGFGSAVVEAAAAGLPAVGTEVTGLVDAMVGGVTGLLVPPKDVDALAAALQTLIVSPDLRGQFGRAARERAIAAFDARVVNGLVVEEYLRFHARSDSGSPGRQRGGA